MISRHFILFLFIIMEAFLGSWKMTSSDGFDAVMERLGVDFITRKTGNLIKPVIKLTEVQDADMPGTYNLKTINTLRTTEVQFRLQEPFLETTVDGRKVKSVITLERADVEGDYILKQCQVGDKVAEIERRLESPDIMQTVREFQLIYSYYSIC